MNKKLPAAPVSYTHLFCPHRSMSRTNSRNRKSAKFLQSLLYRTSVFTYDIRIVTNHFSPILIQINTGIQKATVYLSLIQIYYFDAENCFNTAVNLHPANFKAVYNRGKLRLKTENTEGAIADLDKATSLKPEHAGAHELFGEALLKAGKEVEAALHLSLIHILSPEIL